MSEKENPLPSSPETKELSLEACIELKNEALLKVGVPESALESITIENAFGDEENPDDPVLCLRYRKDGEIKFQEIFTGKDLFAKYQEAFTGQYFFARACLNIASIFRKEGEEWREGVSNLEYYRHVKDKTLLKHGFPEKELARTNCILAVFESHLLEGEPGDPTLVYAGKSGEPLGWEPFHNEAEFEEVCEKVAGYAEEVKQGRLANINGIINDLRGKIDRVWTHNPEEQPGEYDFDGKLFVTPGVLESLTEDEIQFLMLHVRKRVTENDGADYLQTFTADDGEKVWAKDQLDRKMKASGDFKPEYNYATLYKPGED